MSQYEQLIEFIINEQEDKARELFHQIVVGKSREIYESLMDEEDFGGNEVEDLEGEVTADEEGFGDDEAAFGAGEEGAEGEENLETRVLDLEDAMDEIEAKFAELVADEANEPEHNDGIDDPEFMSGAGEEEMGAEDEMFAEAADEEEDDEEEEDLEESRKPSRRMTEAEWIREYVEKIGEFPGDQASPSGKMAGTGAKSEKQGEKNTKSIVAGKNDMGGTAKNIVGKQGATNQDPDGKPVPKASNEYTKGEGKLKGAGQFKNAPGGNAGKSTFKTQEGEYSKEHGAEGQTTDGSVPVAKKSLLKRIGK
jgi:hypothetical protein